MYRPVVNKSARYLRATRSLFRHELEQKYTHEGGNRSQRSYSSWTNCKN